MGHLRAVDLAVINDQDESKQKDPLYGFDTRI